MPDREFSVIDVPLKNILRKIMRIELFKDFAIMILSMIFLPSCYVSKQIWHHGILLSERKKVVEIIGDTQTSPTTRKKLLEVQKIIDYARLQGLNVENSYEYYIESPSPVVSYLVQAAYVDRLEFKTWWFPVVGEVPYLGFYDKSERDELARSLEEEGFDVKRGAAGAFSSLGWFQDPIFSSMLRRSEFSLAHLFFHELTHRTIWIPNSADFNENLAEFIGYILTRDYLHKGGKKQELAQYQTLIRDKNRFRFWLIELKNELKKIYAKNIEKKIKLEEKKKIFMLFTQGSKKAQFEQFDFISEIDEWNNAVVLSSSMYSPDLKRFNIAFKCFENKTSAINDFLQALKKAVETDSDPYIALSKICSLNQKT
jgi:predicted aminopeptidase